MYQAGEAVAVAERGEWGWLSEKTAGLAVDSVIVAGKEIPRFTLRDAVKAANEYLNLRKRELKLRVQLKITFGGLVRMVDRNKDLRAFRIPKLEERAKGDLRRVPTRWRKHRVIRLDHLLDYVDRSIEVATKARNGNSWDGRWPDKLVDGQPVQVWNLNRASLESGIQKKTLWRAAHDGNPVLNAEMRPVPAPFQFLGKQWALREDNLVAYKEHAFGHRDLPPDTFTRKDLYRHFGAYTVRKQLFIVHLLDVGFAAGAFEGQQLNNRTRTWIYPKNGGVYDYLGKALRETGPPSPETATPAAAKPGAEAHRRGRKRYCTNRDKTVTDWYLDENDSKTYLTVAACRDRWDAKNPTAAFGKGKPGVNRCLKAIARECERRGFPRPKKG